MAIQKKNKSRRQRSYMLNPSLDLNRDPLTNIFFKGNNRLVTASEEKKQDWNPANMLVISVSASETYPEPEVNLHAPKELSLTMVAFVAQCVSCNKWRTIPGEQLYEEIRATISQTGFECKKNCYWATEMSCETSQAIVPKESAIWVKDFPSIPKTPVGWKRSLSIRSPGSTRFADVYYIPPIEPCRRLKSSPMVAKYIKQHRQLGNVNPKNDFCFKGPKPLQRNYVIPRVRHAWSTNHSRDENPSFDNEARDTSHPVLDLPPGLVKKKRRSALG